MMLCVVILRTHMLKSLRRLAPKLEWRKIIVRRGYGRNYYVCEMEMFREIRDYCF